MSANRVILSCLTAAVLVLVSSAIVPGSASAQTRPRPIPTKYMLPTGDEDLRQRMDFCSRVDARCVGHVLLDAIQQSGTQPGESYDEITFEIDFFNSRNCVGNKEVSIRFTEDTARNEEKCTRYAPTVTNYIFSVKIDGRCMNFNDGPWQNFQSACLRFK